MIDRAVRVDTEANTTRTEDAAIDCKCRPAPAEYEPSGPARFHRGADRRQDLVRKRAGVRLYRLPILRRKVAHSRQISGQERPGMRMTRDKQNVRARNLVFL